MTIEEMQTVWSEMTDKINNQKRLTDKLIMDMTQQKFNNRIGKIKTIEGAGAIVCFILAVLLLFSIDKLDTWYLIACGIFVAAYLFIAPTMILKSIMDMKSIDIHNNSFSDSISQFSKRRTRFLLLQRIFIILNLVLIIVVLPIASKIFKGNDLFIENQTVWYWYVPMMLLFMVPFSIWGYKSYKRMTASAEALLRDL